VWQHLYVSKYKATVPPDHHTWILVAGTGLRVGVARGAQLAATAVGRAIANHGCGLVTGGWPGVDYIAAEAFAAVERVKGARLQDRLVQVVREDRNVEFDGGRIVRTKVGALEWLEPQSYCDAVVLIGGVGGTYGAFLSALFKGLPRFPLGGVGGDSEHAFRNMCELWDALPNPGVPKWRFEELGRAVTTDDDAEAVAQILLPLVIESVAHQKGQVPRTVFLSYSRDDSEWMRRIEAALRPIEQSGRYKLWADVEIEAGAAWDRELRRKLAVCDVAVLLVSRPFLQSEYVRNVELPILVERARSGRTRVLWLLVSECAWEQTELRELQAAWDPRSPLAALSPAEVQVALVEVRGRVAPRPRAT